MIQNSPRTMALLSRIARIGNSALHRPCSTVSDFKHDELIVGRNDLHLTLNAFREYNGFGRAIAANQLELPFRMIACNLDGLAMTLHNPEIVWRSDETHTLWDDCFSFPDVMVRVRRNKSISVKFFDEEGKAQVWDRLPEDRSELFQHEIDHLDGITSFDRLAPISRQEWDELIAAHRQRGWKNDLPEWITSVAYRNHYETLTDQFDALVDWVPGGHKIFKEPIESS